MATDTYLYEGKFGKLELNAVRKDTDEFPCFFVVNDNKDEWGVIIRGNVNSRRLVAMFMKRMTYVGGYCDSEGTRWGADNVRTSVWDDE